MMQYGPPWATKNLAGDSLKVVWAEFLASSWAGSSGWPVEVA